MGSPQAAAVAHSSLAQPDTQPLWRPIAQRQGTRTMCTPGSTCLALVPSYDHHFCRGSPEERDRIGDAKALGEVTSPSNTS